MSMKTYITSEVDLSRIYTYIYIHIYIYIYEQQISVCMCFTTTKKKQKKQVWTASFKLVIWTSTKVYL